MITVKWDERDLNDKCSEETARTFKERFHVMLDDTGDYDFMHIEIETLGDFLWLVDHQDELAPCGGTLSIRKCDYYDEDYIITFD